MRFFYTGAKTYLAEQKDPSYSLGGCISKTPIPNGLKGAIFSDISLSEIDLAEKEGFELFGMVLKNELANDVTDIILYLDYPETTYVKYEFAFVSVTGNDSVGYTMEQLSNKRSLPYYAGDFYNPNGIANAINIGNLASNEYLGIWIKKTLIDGIKDLFSNDALCIGSRLATPSPIIFVDKVKIEMDWTVVPLVP